MRALHLTFLALFFALSALPMVDRYWPIVPDPGLHGSVVTPEKVALSGASYFDGTFQQAFEKGFDAALAVRSALVRSDNELNLRAFHEFSPSAGTPLVLGKQGNIFEKKYVDDYNRRDVVPAAALESKVQRLKLLQDYVEAHGSTLLVVISPSKALVYPELLPEKFVYDERLSVPHDYPVFVSLLEKYGVNFLDAQRFLTDAKTSSPFRWFSKTGGHWNDPAVCLVTAQIQQFIQRRLQEPGLELHCDAYTMKPPVRQDRDLLDVANVWSEASLALPVPYMDARVEARGRLQRPSVLFVGSSFVWHILDYVNRYNLHRRDTFYYYYKARMSYPGGKSTIDPKRLDWRGEVFAKQAIVIEVNASVVDQVGFGFLEDAERVIRAP